MNLLPVNHNDFIEKSCGNFSFVNLFSLRLDGNPCFFFVYEIFHTTSLKGKRMENDYICKYISCVNRATFWRFVLSERMQWLFHIPLINYFVCSQSKHQKKRGMFSFFFLHFFERKMLVRFSQILPAFYIFGTRFNFNLLIKMASPFPFNEINVLARIDNVSLISYFDVKQSYFTLMRYYSGYQI